MSHKIKLKFTSLIVVQNIGWSELKVGNITMILNATTSSQFTTIR